MTASHFEINAEGLPWGAYDVSYYARSGADFVAQAGFDRDVSHAYVERLSLGAGEVAIARCTSQPGGALVADSAGTARAYRSWCEREDRSRALKEQERATEAAARRAKEHGEPIRSWRLLSLESSVVRFTTVDQADKHETRHAISLADLAKYAADPSAAKEGWKSLPWSEIREAARAQLGPTP